MTQKEFQADITRQALEDMRSRYDAFRKKEGRRQNDSFDDMATALSDAIRETRSHSEDEYLIKWDELLHRAEVVLVKAKLFDI